MSSVLEPRDILLLDRLSGGIIARSFSPPDALDRFKRLTHPVRAHLDITWIDQALGLPQTPGWPVLLYAYPELIVDDADTTEIQLHDGTVVPYCTVDIIAVRPSHIIPTRLFRPYAGLQRSESVSQNTDMLPIFFRSSDGGVGVPLNAGDHYASLPASLTRISAYSLKVVLNLLNYKPYERQIRPRASKARGNVTVRRLAYLVALKVCECLQVRLSKH
ncbi:unnamed protein product [Peniophora sp. CBMAI 1063]|nr:unnamed protein product [Peniophora sp. CBMAI 1063]